MWKTVPRHKCCRGIFFVRTTCCSAFRKTFFAHYAGLGYNLFMDDTLCGPYDGIIMDIDGTIWNTTGIVAVAWNKAVEESGFDARKVTAQDLQREFGKPMNVIADDLWQNLLPQQREILLARCCTEEQIALRASSLHITYPNVLETVSSLSEHYSFYVVSNCQNGYVELMLEKTGLLPYIKDFECYGRTGKGKAENILMLKARAQLSFPLYIGDTQGDADACAQACVPFAWASYGFGSVDEGQCAAILRDFSDLKDILERRR